MSSKGKYSYTVSGAGRQMVDITGQQFGRLTALYPTDKRDCKGSIYWHCKCSCGNEKDIPVDALITGDYVSCGCRKKEINENVSSYLHFIDGTCVEWLRSRKYRSDNTSGFRGVNQRKDGKYIATIGFRNKRYYIGTFTNYEEAVSARIEAEEEIHEGFLKAYDSWQQHAKEDPVWAENHPFFFTVEKVNGNFKINTNGFAK